MTKTKVAALLAVILLAFFGPSLPASAKSLVTLMTSDVGKGRPAGCPKAWCACYLEKTLKKAGLRTLGSNKASAFAKYGKKAKAGQVGAIMVMPHHVGVVAGKCEDGRIKLVSGNHGNKVGTGCYAAGKAIAWRMPG
jgi:uncharacterized protein (TIGR02594 family)